MSKRRGLTRGQARRVHAYVSELLENLRLNQWDVLVSERPPSAKDVFAQIVISRCAHEAVLRIDYRQFAPLNRAAQRQVITHELCHLVADKIDATVGHHGRPAVKGKRARRIANDTFVEAMETTVDDFAWLLAPHQPLPPKGWLR